MRLLTATNVILFAGLGLVGCGDDSGTPIDGAVGSDAPVLIDAKPIDAPDAHQFDGLFANEGGEVRLEYVNHPTPTANVSAAATRATAFFFKDAGSTDFFAIPSFMGCTDMTDKTHWPVAQNPVGERVYADPGTVVVSTEQTATAPNTLGTPLPLQIPRSTGTGGPPEAFDRTMVANEWFTYNNAPGGSDAATFIKPDALYDVTLGGSDDLPAYTFDDGIYVPPSFDLISPGLNVDNTVPNNYYLSTGDHTFTWSVPTPTNLPSDLKLFSLIGFTGNKGPSVVCIEENDGSMTIPSAMVDVVRSYYAMGNGIATGNGTFARQLFAHTIRELVDANGPTGKRVDLIGMWCYAEGFTVIDPP